MKLRLKGGRIVDPANGVDRVDDVWIEGQRIAAIGRRPRGFKAAREIDVRNHVVCPGFIELAAHLREPGDEHKATIASELAAAAAGGFTTVCCTPDTDPVVDTPAVVELIHQRAHRVKGARVRCIGALTRGLGGEVLAEMQALKTIGCVAVSNGGRAITDTNVLKNALAYATTLDMTVILQCEDPWLGRSGVMHEGATSTAVGLAGIPVAAELIGLARDLLLVAETGARAHFHTLSAAASVTYLADAKRRKLPVSADVGMAHLHLYDEVVTNHEAVHHVRPPLRARRDCEGLRRALGRRRIEAVSAHHEPHDADAKAAPFAASEAGMSGLDTYLPLLLDLVRGGVLDLGAAIEAAAVRPARILGVDGGSLAPGAIADVCVFDPDRRWTVTTDALYSMGRNTPFLGAEMLGRATHTLVAGRLVHVLDD